MQNPFEGLISLKEAADRWHRDEGTLRHAIERGKLQEGTDVKKFGKQWVVTVAAMEREWGKHKKPSKRL